MFIYSNDTTWFLIRKYFKSRRESNLPLWNVFANNVRTFYQERVWFIPLQFFEKATETQFWSIDDWNKRIQIFLNSLRISLICIWMFELFELFSLIKITAASLEWITAASLGRTTKEFSIGKNVQVKCLHNNKKKLKRTWFPDTKKKII